MTMTTIEVEARSFISQQQYEELLQKFETEATFLDEDNETNIYLTGPEDLRIMEGDHHAKVWVKTGKLHDDFREEVEVAVSKDNFPNLKKLLHLSGHETKIIWKRNRKRFVWKEITVCMDFTHHYGYIIELEKITTPAQAEKVHAELVQELRDLDVTISAKANFEEAFEYYTTHWREWYTNS